MTHSIGPNAYPVSTAYCSNTPSTASLSGKSPAPTDSTHHKLNTQSSGRNVKDCSLSLHSATLLCINQAKKTLKTFSVVFYTPHENWKGLFRWCSPCSSNLYVQKGRIFWKAITENRTSRIQWYKPELQPADTELQQYEGFQLAWYVALPCLTSIIACWHLSWRG